MIPLQTFGLGMVGLALLIAFLVLIVAILQGLADDAAGTPSEKRNFLGGIIGLSLTAFLIGVLGSEAISRLYDAAAELESSILTINSGETHTVESATEEEYEGVDIHETGTLVIQEGGTLTIND